MKRHLITKLPFARSVLAALLGLATTAYGGVASMDVTVFDAAAKVAFRGPMTNATFATQSLPPGDYVVQFNSKSARVKGNHYLLVISAGKKKVIATAVPGETFIAGGAAMRINVRSDSKITGQIVNDQAMAQGDGSIYRVIDGTRFVWVTGELGSNRGGHWAEESLPPSANIVAWRIDDMRKRQDRGGEGTMIPYAHPTLVPSGY